MPLHEIHALMLRTVAREIADNMAPALDTPGARERAAFAREALDLVAAHQDLLPAIAAESIKAFHAALDAAFGVDAVDSPTLDALRDRYQEVVTTPRDAESELTALRALAADVIRALTDSAIERMDPTRAMALQGATDALGAVDRDWLLLFADARARALPAKGSGATTDASAPVAVDSVTPAGMTRYLQARYPGVRVTDAVLLSGGRSKRTLLLTLDANALLPERLVMRQDMAVRHMNSRVVDEVEPLRRLHARGLPVPELLHVEAAVTELGPPFLLLPFLRGAPPGDYFGLTQRCPGAYLDLARALALLHRTSASTAGLTRPDTHTDPLRSYIEGQWAIWRKSLRPSPFIDHAFARAVRDCSETTGIWSAVHGDCGPHNLLVEDDRLVTILDWEFAHAGDPAEDLGIARIYAEQTMDWRDFMAAYRVAGGPEIPERRIRAGMLSHYLKGAALSATSTRNVVEGGNRDYIKAMISFTGLPQIEMKLMQLMRDDADG